MQIGGQDYYRAALERMTDARLLYMNAEGSYSLTMYSAELAVECMCRGFIWSVNGEFDGRHHLPRLIKESKILQAREDTLRDTGASAAKVHAVSMSLRAATNTVSRLWSNTYRFVDETKVRSELNTQRAYTGIKGDALRENCRKLIEAAIVIIETGEILWILRRK